MASLWRPLARQLVRRRAHVPGWTPLRSPAEAPSSGISMSRMAETQALAMGVERERSGDPAAKGALHDEVEAPRPGRS